MAEVALENAELSTGISEERKRRNYKNGNAIAGYHELE